MLSQSVIVEVWFSVFGCWTAIEKLLYCLLCNRGLWFSNHWFSNNGHWTTQGHAAWKTSWLEIQISKLERGVSSLNLKKKKTLTVLRSINFLTSGSLSRIHPSERYEALKSWPHWDTQWASSIATNVSPEMNTTVFHASKKTTPNGRTRGPLCHYLTR